MAKETKHILYKTTCTVTNRYYIGMHSTKNLNDGYIGSGKRLWRSIKKHGKENHVMKILEFLNSREELIEREKFIVNEDLLKDPMCMNMVIGGEGGAGHMTKQQLSKGGKKTLTKNWKDPEYVDKMKKIASKTFIRLHKDGLLKGYPNWTGKRHKQETKDKIGQANSISQKGERNSQFGTMWINNGDENKKIKKTEFEHHEFKDWKIGRIKAR